MCAGHRALDRILPKQYLPQWSRLSELAAESVERSEKRAAREQATKKRAEQRNKQELKELLTKTGVAMTMDKVELVQQLISEPTATAALPYTPVGEQASLDAKLVRRLRELGLSEQHIDLAAASVPDGAGLDDTLDWLCMHIDAADLPPKLRGNNRSGVTVVRAAADKGGLANLDWNAADDPCVQSLTQFGFSVPDAIAALKLFDGEPAPAWGALFSRATGITINSAGLPASALDTQAASCTEDDAGESDWRDELIVMASMYEDQVLHTSSHAIRMQVPLPAPLHKQYAHNSGLAATPAPVEIVAVTWPAARYPEQPPLFGVCCPDLPGPVRIAITSQVAAHLSESALGAPMLHELYNTVTQQLSSGTAPLLSAARLRFSNLMASSLAVASQDTEVTAASSAKAPAKRGGRPGGGTRVRTAAQAAAEAQALRELRERAETGSSMKAMRTTRRKLPAFAQREQVLAAVEGHRAVVIAGATGCGKSTQVCGARSPAGCRIARHECWAGRCRKGGRSVL